MKWTYLPIALVAHAGIAAAASATEWQNQVIYQVLTDRFARTDGGTNSPCNVEDQKYCGGTWQGIIKKLDYIQGMGFTAVWISPVTKQAGPSTGGAEPFHGYWQSDLYSLNENFGTADDLKALSAELHKRGMYLMVDVVANHFAWPGNFDAVDYSTYNPFNKQSYFHTYCPITQDDYDHNQTAVEDCWLGDSSMELTDVDTQNPDVVQGFNTWISQLVSNYSIDGLRIDTVKHVQKDFWSGFTQAAGVYSIGEVFDGDADFLCPYQEVMDGLMNYPLFFALTSAFKSTSGSMSDLAKAVDTVKSTCKNSTLMAPFLENHDNPRFPSLTPDMALDTNAIAFTLLSDGVPIIYEGQEQHFSGGSDPGCREAVWTADYATDSSLYGFISTLNKVRKAAISKDGAFVDYQAFSIYDDATTIAMRKGYDGHQIVGVFSNKGSSGDSYSQDIPNTGFKSGEAVTEILGCDQATAGDNGTVTAAMGQGAAKIFYATANLQGTGLCGN